nr:FeoA family protein [[Phormidium] sp. ETS-05]
MAGTKVGDRVEIVELGCGESNNRLMGMGLMPGTVLEVISRTPSGSVIVTQGEHRLGLGADMAHLVQVIAERSEHSTGKNVDISNVVPLRDAVIGSTLRVIGYRPIASAYKGKLLAMGLTPGTEFVVNRHAPLGDPIEIEVRGFRLSLRKGEADALIAEAARGG